ncbi:mucin-2-like [Chamaea fasciata]|uniref:mucin-2-like n=1 Tax=Chamaea fasciata TaxID=190680 RepID=UPI003369C673
MVWAAPALAAATLYLRVSTDLLKVTAAALVLGAVLSSAEHPRLGEAACDLEPGTIPASDPKILEKLKLCPALTGAPRDALNALLLSGATAYGDPSSWDLQTLRDLGPLVLALNQTTLRLVGEAAREDFRRTIAAAYTSQGGSQREKSLLLLRALAAASAPARPRLKRSSGRCESQPITASSIGNIPLLSPEELDLCLSSEVLIENLEAVLSEPITTDGFQVLKKKVDKFFPSGIPEEQLRRLGELSHLYTEQEISRWPVTSGDTLTALLSSSGELWNDSQVQQLFSTYLALGGSWTGSLLQEIGGEFLCKLQEEEMQQIPAGAIGSAGQLNISSCSQSKKELLYGKAREAFASTPGPYYCRIRPYLGGAPAEDLKDLANAGDINMDLDTFLALNPQEFQKLSVTDVKNLLGENVPELRRAEQQPWVRSWVQRQLQRELDCVLGIGLQGGTAPTSPPPVTSANVTPVSTTLPPVPSATSASATTLPTVPTTSASVTVPTPNAISSHSTPQPSTVPPRTPSPPNTHTYTGGPPVPPATPTVPTATPTVPTATPTARPTLTTAAPCSTHQAVTTDRATSPAVTSPAVTSPATSSPSATPVPAVTSGATTGTGVGTHLTGTTHSTVTPVPNSSSAPTATHSTVTNPSSAPTVTPVPNPSSTATATPVSQSSSAATATHSTVTPNSTSAPTVTPVPNPSSAPTVTPVPNPSSTATATPVSQSSSAATATHSTVTPNSTFAPTVSPVPNPSSAPTVTPVPNPSSGPTVTSVPNLTSSPTATTVSNSTSSPTVTSVPNPSSAPTVTSVPKPSTGPTVTPVPNPTSPTATHGTATTVPNSPSSPTVTPVPNPSPSPSVAPVPQSPSVPPSATTPSPAVPCQPSSPPNPPSTTPGPGNVPEPPAPTSNGHINLQPAPEPGSGSRLCSCLVPVLAATVGTILLL